MGGAAESGPTQASAVATRIPITLVLIVFLASLVCYAFSSSIRISADELARLDCEIVFVDIPLFARLQADALETAQFFDWRFTPGATAFLYSCATSSPARLPIF